MNFIKIITTPLLLTFFLYSGFVLSKETTISSIIKLDKNIPVECGIIINKKSNTFIYKIKKKKEVTKLILSVEPEKEKVLFSNIITESVNFKKDFKFNDNSNEKKYELIAENDLNLTNNFFKELFVSGAKIIINDNYFNLKGPIDSKVRLEYLFCTGEMFHPKYKN